MITLLAVNVVGLLNTYFISKTDFVRGCLFVVGVILPRIVCSLVLSVLHGNNRERMKMHRIVKYGVIGSICSLLCLGCQPLEEEEEEFQEIDKIVIVPGVESEVIVNSFDK